MKFPMHVLAGVAVAWMVVAPALAFEECGELEMPGTSSAQYGPFDYRTDKSKLPIVERFHFTPDVENLKRGLSGDIEGDLAYTLGRFPNHHRALYAMERFLERRKVEKTRSSVWSANCWYDRAVRWRTDDGVVRVLYGNFLAKRGKREEALLQLEKAGELVGGSVTLNYNLGLAYVEIKEYDKALQYAHVAYGLGFPLPGLRNRLERAGKWKPQPPEPAVTTPADERVEPPKAPAESKPASDAPTKPDKP